MKPEAAVQKAVLDLLTAERVLAFRMNSGALLDRTGRPVKFGVTGMADVLALPIVPVPNAVSISGSKTPAMVMPFWIECKSPTGRVVGQFEHD